MSTAIDLIRAYTDGAVYTHAVGATITAPTDASTALDVDFVEVGAIGEDGLTETTDQETTNIFIWQGNRLARTLKGQATKTWQFAAAQTSLFNLGLQYAGSTVTSTSEGASVAEKPPTTDVRAWVLHGLDGDREQRIYIPRGEITARGEVVWSANGITVYEWTLSAYTDDSGNWAYRYYVDDDMSTP